MRGLFSVFRFFVVSLQQENNYHNAMKLHSILPASLLAIAALMTAGGAAAQSLVTPSPAAVATSQCGPLDAYSADAEILRGILAYTDRNYVGCVNYMERALRSDLDDTCTENAMLYRGLATLGIEGRGERGVAMLEEYLDTYPVSIHRGRVLTAIAGYRFDKGEYARALRIYADIDAATLNGALRDTRDYYLAFCYLKVARYDTATRLYASLYGSREYGAAARFYTAYAAYAAGDMDRALTLFRDVDTRTAPGSTADFYRAQIYYGRREWSKAMETASALLERRGGDIPADFVTEACRIAGESLYNLDRPAKAMPLLRRYVSEAGDDALPSALYALGVCLYDTGDYDEAVRRLTPVSRLDNAMGQSASLYIGQAAVRSRDYDAATLAFERAARMDFDEDVARTAFYNYAVARMQGGRVPFGSQVALLEEFLQRYPASPYDTRVREYLVAGYMTDDNYEAALRSIERIKEKTPEMQRAYQQILYNLGIQRLAAGATDAAADMLQRAAAMRDDADVTAQATLWLADARYRQGRYGDARTLYRRFIDGARRGTPNLSRAYYSMGYAAFDDKRYADALPYFRHFVDNPGDATASLRADALSRIGDIELHDLHFDAAADSYTKARSLDPATGDYPLYQTAIMRGYRSDYKGKSELLQQLMREYPNSSRIPAALLESAEAQRLGGDVSAALSTYDTLIARYPATPQARRGILLAAQARLNTGDVSRATEMYRGLITRYPTSAEARTAADALKDLYAADGRLDEYVAFINSVPDAPTIAPDEIDRLTFEAARSHWYADGDVSRVSKYLQDIPGGHYRADALLIEAQDAMKRGDDDTALNRVTAIVTAFPDAAAAPQALLIKGTVEARGGNADKALVTLQQLRDKAPDAVTLDAARLGIMRAAVQLGRYDTALSAAGELTGSSNLSSDDAAEVVFTRGLALSRTGDTDGAIKVWNTIAADTDTLDGAKAAYHAAQLLFDTGHVAAAHTAADNLADSNTPHRYWLARDFILLSDILRAEGHTFEADEYLRSLRDNYPGTEADIFSAIDSRLNNAK